MPCPLEFWIRNRHNSINFEAKRMLKVTQFSMKYPQLLIFLLSLYCVSSFPLMLVILTDIRGILGTRYLVSSFRLLSLTLWLTMSTTKLYKCRNINCWSYLIHRYHTRNDVDVCCNQGMTYCGFFSICRLRLICLQNNRHSADCRSRYRSNLRKPPRVHVRRFW